MHNLHWLELFIEVAYQNRQVLDDLGNLLSKLSFWWICQRQGLAARSDVKDQRARTFVDVRVTECFSKLDSLF